MATELKRHDQLSQPLMDSMQVELIEKTKSEVKGDILCLSAIHPR